MGMSLLGIFIVGENERPSPSLWAHAVEIASELLRKKALWLNGKKDILA